MYHLSMGGLDSKIPELLNEIEFRKLLTYLNDLFNIVLGEIIYLFNKKNIHNSVSYRQVA